MKRHIKINFSKWENLSFLSTNSFAVSTPFLTPIIDISWTEKKTPLFGTYRREICMQALFRILLFSSCIQDQPGQAHDMFSHEIHVWAISLLDIPRTTEFTLSYYLASFLHQWSISLRASLGKIGILHFCFRHLVTHINSNIVAMF